MAWYLYIVRTPTIAKNRHLNIVLQAELFLRTGTYDRPKNTVPVGTCTGYGDTFGPALAQKNTKPWRSTPIHVWPATKDNMGELDNMVDRTGSGKGLLTHFLMKHLERSGKEKKDPLRGSFFSYRPSAGAAPRSVPTQQTVYVVAPTLQLLTISLAKPFLSNTT